MLRSAEEKELRLLDNRSVWILTMMTLNPTMLEVPLKLM